MPSMSRQGSAIDQAEAERIENMAAEMADSNSTPPWGASYLRKAAPVIGIFGAIAESTGPIVYQLGVGVYAIYQGLPKQASLGLWGLGLCFYGGRFSVTIAAIEAFQVIGGSKMISCLKDICSQISAVKQAHDEDEKVDADEDGTADVSQIDKNKLVQRKTLLVLRTVDPEVLSNAIGGLWSGYMGMLAVLRFKFAQTVALAHSIGDTLRPAAAKLFAPSLISVTPKEYQRWINPSLNFGCKLVAGFLAWRIQRVLSTVQSGVKGGLLVSRSLIALLREAGWFKAPDDSTVVDEFGGYALASCGIYYQLLHGGLPLPFFVKPVFWPLDITEWLLQWSVTWIGSDQPAKDAK